MTAQPATLPDEAWYISAGNQVFGPYSHAQMAQFARENRLAARSLVRAGATGDFQPAVSHAALAPVLLAPSPGPAPAAQGAVADKAAPRTAGIPDGEMSNLVVYVNLRMGSTRDFEAEMKTLGTFAKLSTHLWLLQTTHSSNTARMALAPHVGSQEQLFIVDAGRNRIALQNFSVFDASRMRDIWRLPHERT